MGDGRFKSLWRSGFESTPQEVTISSTLLCREWWERENDSSNPRFDQLLVWLGVFLSSWAAGKVGWGTKLSRGLGLTSQAKPLLHSAIICLSHAEVRLGSLSPLPISQRNQCLIAVFDFFSILLKLKLRGYLPPSQDPYSSWQRSGSDLWDIK